MPARTPPAARPATPRTAAPTTPTPPVPAPRAPAQPQRPAAQAQAYQRRKARAHAKAEAVREQERARVQVLPLTNPQAAGIDVGSRSHWVCCGYTADADADAGRVREFAAHTEGLRQLLAFLQTHGVRTVAMESTGVYWIPLFELLAAAGLEVLLVDPKCTRQVKGRPKTDRRDCQWIYRLHSVGLLAGAFRPDAATCVLRSYLRQRADLVRGAARDIQHMQKALEQMNLKLTTVVSDVSGVTGRKIIQAILKGERDPHKLAALRNERCRASAAEIARALDGSYREDHLFALRQAFAGWQFAQQQVDEVDGQIAAQLGRMRRPQSLPPLAEKRRGCGPRPNDPRFDVRMALYYVTGVDLTELEGISEMTALTVVSEIGADLSQFATVKHFCSWLGLCPQVRQTGGKVQSARTRPGKNRAAEALRLGASSLHHSRSALGAYLRRMKSRLGAPAAVTAAAHKLARLVYGALKHGLPYVRQTQAEYEARQREREIQSLRKKARRLNLVVVEKPAGAAKRSGEGVATP